MSIAAVEAFVWLAGALASEPRPPRALESLSYFKPEGIFAVLDPSAPHLGKRQACRGGRKQGRQSTVKLGDFCYLDILGICKA